MSVIEDKLKEGLNDILDQGVEDGVVQFAYDEVSSIAQKVKSAGDNIQNTMKNANQGGGRLTEEMFGHILGPLVTNPLNQLLDGVCTGFVDAGQLFTGAGEGMQKAIDHLFGRDEQNAANIGGAAH